LVSFLPTSFKPEPVIVSSVRWRQNFYVYFSDYFVYRVLSAWLDSFPKIQFQVNKVPSPKVVLASTPDMEAGFSRELLLHWGANPKNSIIFTNRCAPGTLGHDLVSFYTTLFLRLRTNKLVFGKHF
jgi:Cft2 family RNA processing exonuclease